MPNQITLPAGSEVMKQKRSTADRTVRGANHGLGYSTRLAVIVRVCFLCSSIHTTHLNSNETQKRCIAVQSVKDLLSFSPVFPPT